MKIHSDLEIQKRLQISTSNYDLYKNFNIQILVVNGNVTLTGVVENYYQKDEAATIIETQIGVKTIDNEIAVGYLD